MRTYLFAALVLLNVPASGPAAAETIWVRGAGGDSCVTLARPAILSKHRRGRTSQEGYMAAIKRTGTWFARWFKDFREKNRPPSLTRAQPLRRLNSTFPVLPSRSWLSPRAGLLYSPSTCPRCSSRISSTILSRGNVRRSFGARHAFECQHASFRVACGPGRSPDSPPRGRGHTGP
jgi:hypothetical protein